MYIRLNRYNMPEGVKWWKHIISGSTNGNKIIRLGPNHHLWIFKHKPIDK